VKKTEEECRERKEAGRDVKEEYACPISCGSSVMMSCPQECTVK